VRPAISGCPLDFETSDRDLLTRDLDDPTREDFGYIKRPSVGIAHHAARPDEARGDSVGE
jgi:hypothetical protein